MSTAANYEIFCAGYSTHSGNNWWMPGAVNDVTTMSFKEIRWGYLRYKEKLHQGYVRHQEWLKQHQQEPAAEAGQEAFGSCEVVLHERA